MTCAIEDVTLINSESDALHCPSHPAKECGYGYQLHPWPEPFVVASRTLCAAGILH